MAAEGVVDLEPVARRVADRLTLRRALGLANRTVSWAAGAAVLSVVLGRQLGPGGSSWFLAPVVLGGWAVGCAFLAWRHRPDVYAALAYWDDVSLTTGSLASAWWFGKGTASTTGERLHLRQAAEILGRRVEELDVEIPIGKIARHWWLLLLVPSILVSGLGRRALAWEELPLTSEMKEEAATIAEDLAAVREKLKESDPTAPEQASKDEKLEDILAGAEELLGKAGKATTGEMLNGLEDRARMIEALAKEFRGEDDWVPPAVLEELERHADTAPLAGEIREKRPLGGASESDQLAELAKTPAAADRLKQALDAAMGKVSDQEPASPVMGHLAAAETHLEARQSDQAGGEFQELGEYFRGLARKQEAREELQALAAQLREGAEELAGATLEGARETGPAETPPPGAESLTAQAPPTPSENAAATTPPPVPPGGPKSPSPSGNAAPMPGPPGGPVPGQAAAPVPVPGTTAPPPSASLALQAPVPGQPPGGAPQTLSAPVPGQPVPGAPGSTPGMQPGLNAGEGTAALVPAPSKTLASTRDDTVDAKIGTEGESETRAVQSNKVRTESATLETRDAGGNFLSVEEGAMDEQALPAGRRDQVRRYFNALRQSFDTEESP